MMFGVLHTVSNGMPAVVAKFRYSSVLQRIQVKLPLAANKFLESTQMDAAQFFQRWKMLSQ
jgi:AP-2 complex subunit alpha